MSQLTKVKFLQSPTGHPFNLAYSVGQIGEVDAEKLALLQENGMVEVMAKPKKTTRESKKKTENR